MWITAGSIAADFTKEDKIIQWEKHEKVKHIKETESNTPTAEQDECLPNPASQYGPWESGMHSQRCKKKKQALLIKVLLKFVDKNMKGLF